jgi:hypothetical protein
VPERDQEQASQGLELEEPLDEPEQDTKAKAFYHFPHSSAMKLPSVFHRDAFFGSLC